MSAALHRTEIGKGIHFSHIPDPKFKRNLITVCFIMPLDAGTASDNAVVPYILRKGCRECPDFSAFNAKLNDLYGANMSAGVSKVNGWQVTSVSIQGLDGRFALEGEDIAGECAALLAKVVLDPKLGDDGFFDEKDVETERRFILDTIEAEVNEKRSYAIQRCMQVMCEGEPVAVRRYGTMETAGKITPESAYCAYRRMLKSAAVEIAFTGSGDPESARSAFSEAFGKMEREPVEFALIPLRTAAEKPKEKKESMELNQAKLVMGFRAGEIKTDEEVRAMRLCSAILGGTPFSKFFQNVREKLSLCYYCASNFDQFNRLMIVDSGIEAANRRMTQGEILRQIKAVQDGKFTEEELADTKLLAANSITRSTDSPTAMESWYLHQILKGGSCSPEQDAKALGEITREQVIGAAKKLSLDTVYVLTGEEGDAQCSQPRTL